MQIWSKLEEIIKVKSFSLYKSTKWAVHSKYRGEVIIVGVHSKISVLV